MPGRFAFAVVFAISGAIAAHAADASSDRNADSHGSYSDYGGRMEPLVIWDNQPGVIVRSYWYPPWANRHYFPKTGRRPKVGRVEHISAHRVPRAEEYFRFWSASSVFLPEIQGGLVPRYGIPPTPYQSQPR
jgi:hypothetical protein